MSYYNIREILNENNLFNTTHISLCTQIGTFAPKEKEIRCVVTRGWGGRRGH